MTDPKKRKSYQPPPGWQVLDQSPPETTRLSPQQETQFQAWVRKHNIRDVDHPESYYDYRGAFLADVKPQIHWKDSLPHFPDTYKQHGHPTFSVESKYSRGPDDGGVWGGPKGETYLPALPRHTLESAPPDALAAAMLAALGRQRKRTP